MNTNFKLYKADCWNEFMESSRGLLVLFRPRHVKMAMGQPPHLQLPSGLLLLADDENIENLQLGKTQE